MFPVLSLVLPLLAGAARAENLFVNDPEPPLSASVRDPEPWQEGAVAFPAWPNAANLVEFRVDGAGAGLRYFIDAASLAVTTDGVTRFVLVAESTSGARNYEYAGLRCTPRGQARQYGFGIQGRWTAAASDWQRIGNTAADAPYASLWRHYLCQPGRFVPRRRVDQLHLLRSGTPPTATPTGFVAD